MAGSPPEVKAASVPGNPPRVGILNADIYGPSQPMMMGISGRPKREDGKTIASFENYGVQVMSFGVLVEPTRR